MHYRPQGNLRVFFSIMYTFYYIALFPVVLKINDKRK